VRFIRLAIALAFLVAASAPAAASELVVPGTGDGLELLRQIATVYSERNPGTKIVLPPSIDSAGGVKSVLEDKTPLGRSALPLTVAEEAAGLASVSIVRVPTVFFTNPTLRITDLTTQQITDIFAGKIKNWDEVGGPNLRIKVVLRDETDSTLQFLRATMPGWKNLVLTDRSKTVPRTFRALEAVSQFEGAIGFGPYAKSMAAQFNVIRIDGKPPASPDYPSFTTVRLIFKSHRLTNEAKNFVKFARSAAAARIYGSYGAAPYRDDDFLWAPED
jgi:phosphate transport system substrate-binding protein